MEYPGEDYSSDEEGPDGDTATSTSTKPSDECACKCAVVLCIVSLTLVPTRASLIKTNQL